METPSSSLVDRRESRGSKERSKDRKSRHKDRSRSSRKSRDDDTREAFSSTMPPPATPPIRAARVGGFMGDAAVAGSLSDSSPRETSAIFPLSHADKSTYISVVKSDIYQLQMKLESVLRSMGRAAGSAGKEAATPRSSKRRQEIANIKNATADVDFIVQNTKSSTELKLKLLEHLCGVMIQMELASLQATSKGANRPFAPALSARGGRAGSKETSSSFSRLPSFLALVDRTIELHGKAEDSASSATASQHSHVVSLGNSSVMAGAMEDAMEELEDQLRLLEAELGMQRGGGGALTLFDTHGSAAHQTVNRLKRAGVAVEIVRERGLAFLVEELEEYKKANRNMADILDKTRKDYHALKAKSKPAEATAATDDQQQQRAIEATGGGGGSGEGGGRGEGGVAMQALQKKLRAAQAENEALRSKVERGKRASKDEALALRKQLQRHRLLLDDEEEKHTKEAQQLEKLFLQKSSQTRGELEALRAQLAFKTESVNEAERAARAWNEERVSLQQRLQDLTANHKEVLSRYKQEADLQAERAKLLEDTGGEPSSETGELRLQRELVSKTKRSYHNLEVYIREVTLRRDGELDQARKEIKRLATERVQAEEKARIEAGLKDEHLKTVQAKLQAQLSSDHLSDAHSAIIEVLKEEMHILKSSFQRQVQALKEMAGKTASAHSTALRAQKRLLEEERRQNSQLSKKLDMALEAAGKKS